MRRNNVKKKLEEGKTILNGWLHIPSTWSAELMAHAGWDAVTVDMQHGLMGIETAIQILQAISTTNVVPIARANWNDKSIIMRLLDSGAYGIICPVVNTKEECESFVGACRYPPQGYRSLGPTRARVYAGLDYPQYANEEVLTMAMVESYEAIQNIDSICSVKGLDGIFVGSGDLRMSLDGKPSAIAFDEAIEIVLEYCSRHSIFPGIWCYSVEKASEAMEKGFKFISVKSDGMILNDSAQSIVKEINDHIR